MPPSKRLPLSRLAGGECQVFNHRVKKTCFLKCFVVKSEELDLSLSYQTESQYLTLNRDPEVKDSVSVDRDILGQA